ncbi:hypothetical protein P691DRAFT_735574 [Macrolepiota fuliginosa MF-IS2]|uniref:BTB domain-containing protein n=1 Tax=Macrolepiota fuliginosa MF-IS2 TaxID=1400762 RepID=A0A9P6C160_9AGAR|nr:hypothetical protein P691DRAFT_735574 [Macrolepiota fuliginosa MF-IS2]
MPQVTHKDIEYYVEPLIFSVENTLFRVPREYLAQESPVFLDMLALPQPVTDDEGVGSEGAVDAKPLVLPDTIAAPAFRALLQILYSFNDGCVDADFPKDDWINILELSRMWDMATVRKTAIKGLLPLLGDDAAHQWKLAKKYDIHDWVQPALEKLVRRNQPLTVKEFESLDQRTLLGVAAVRESCYPVFYDSDRQYGDFRYSENTTIGRWEIREGRGEISVDLESFNFNCPSPSLQHGINEIVTSEDDGPSKSGEFYFEKVVFKVEDRLYRVPNQPFAQHSQIFRRNFELRGFSKYDRHDPFVIEDATKDDFEHLLRFFFPPKSIGKREPTSDEWASILRLSARWSMLQVKELAIQKLENLNFGNIATKLRMAQELGVQQWFSPAMKTLITRGEPLNADEYNVLGQQHILQVLDLRERVHLRNKYYDSCNSYGNYNSYGTTPMIHIRSERGEVPIEGNDLTARLAPFL